MSYYTAPPTVVNGDVAYAEDVNGVSSATATGFSLVKDDIDGLIPTFQYWEELAQSWAEEPENTEVEPGKYSALHWSAKASSSASSASSSASSASSSASSASSSASSASSSASSASSSASSASSSASSASSSASTATTKASEASASASTATTQAGIATTKASEASVSASNALTSYNNTVAIYGSTVAVQNAVTTATNAASSASSSASTATTKASEASASASSASTSASNAASSASSALGYSNSAASSASTATTQASVATTQASNASSSASSAASSASSASSSASSASSSASSAASSASAAEVSATEAEAAVEILQKKIEILKNDLLSYNIPAVDKILATTANLVDVFVYNTYNDYDGGAWVEQANYQSWYVEQLNTATRGSKREFPKVALIVAETTKVTIYDATETGCPMWMVFVNSSTNDIIVTGTVSAVSMVNGVLTIAQSGATGGLSIVNFNSEVVRYIYTSGYITYLGNIAARNNDSGWSSITGAGIVNRTVNDVAMTTISRTENSFGLLDPVIAVATEGGVSVIDGPAGVGTVVDSASTNAAKKISIRNSDNNLIWILGTGSASVFVSDSSITEISADGFTSYSTGETPAISYGIEGVTDVIGLSSDTLAIGRSSKLVVGTIDDVTPLNGMCVWISNQFNTGLLKGDIRRALICEAEGTTETLTNLVTNGTFDSDTGWTKGTGWTISGGTANSDGTEPSSSFLTSTSSPVTVAGKKYAVTYTVTRTAGNFRVYINASDAAVSRSSSGTYTDIVTATTNIGAPRLQGSSGFAGTADNIIVTEVILDRSVKASSMVVNGSLTRSPVAAGAELQAISGFSSSNFLSQEYSADLDFGTGDFYITLAFYPTTFVSARYILDRRDTDNTNATTVYTNTTTGEVYFLTSDTSNTVYASGLIPLLNTWNFLTIQRLSTGNCVFTLNGSTATKSGTVRNVSGTDAKLVIGGAVLSAIPFSGGSVALLRIGSGSLSADQIAKIYREELALFQPGAKCTIQGASSAVTALAYNERYNKLLVGTSAGVTSFNNLAVEDGFYTNSGSIKAISSDNKINLCASTAEVKVKKA